MRGGQARGGRVSQPAAPPHSLRLLHSHSQGIELTFEETAGNLLIRRTEQGPRCLRGGFANAF